MGHAIERNSDTSVATVCCHTLDEHDIVARSDYKLRCDVHVLQRFSFLRWIHFPVHGPTCNVLVLYVGVLGIFAVPSLLRCFAFRDAASVLQDWSIRYCVVGLFSSLFVLQLVCSIRVTQQKTSVI